MFSNKKSLIIAEVAQTHEGSLNQAHAFIDAVAKTGVDMIKFQTHIAEAESSKDEPWRVKFSYQDKTRYDYWRRMEFSEEGWISLKKHAEDKGLKFISSAFSYEAFLLLNKIGISAWKVASGEINNTYLLNCMCQTRLPIIVSTGMSDYQEIDQAVELLKKESKEFAILQCTTAYPCPPEQVGVYVMNDFRQRYACPVGISDHSATIYPALAAATLGAEVIEVHVTLSRDMFGPDVIASVTVDELKELVKGVRFIESMRQSHFDKNAWSVEAAPLRRMFNKSLFAKRALAAGEYVQFEDVAIKKPGIGIAASRLDEFLNRRLSLPVQAGELFKEQDFE